jgi:hypothetical protein
LQKLDRQTTEIYEAIEVMFRCKARNSFVAMFFDAPNEIVGDTDVQRSMPAIREDIDVKLIAHLR